MITGRRSSSGGIWSKFYAISSTLSHLLGQFHNVIQLNLIELLSSKKQKVHHVTMLWVCPKIGLHEKSIGFVQLLNFPIQRNIIYTELFYIGSWLCEIFRWVGKFVSPHFPYHSTAAYISEWFLNQNINYYKFLKFLSLCQMLK